MTTQYRCDRCGRDNEFVNQCGCDPHNMPTRVPAEGPGPWELDESDWPLLVCATDREDEDGPYVIATVESCDRGGGKYQFDKAKAKAHARLITAAPELVAALSELAMAIERAGLVSTIPNTYEAACRTIEKVWRPRERNHDS